VISAEARDRIEAHVAAMKRRGYAVERLGLPEACAAGTFAAPTIIEIGAIAEAGQEVFGPVLHVLRFKRAHLDRLIGEINAAGYGLTFGLHTRIDETISRVVNRVEAGNIYVNRNIIGATVGVQPFGGPLYLGRLLATRASRALDGMSGMAAQLPAARAWADWLLANGHDAAAERMIGYMNRSMLGASRELPGPVGERNIYALKARGVIGVVASDQQVRLAAIGAILATGNSAVVEGGADALPARLPPALAGLVSVTGALDGAAHASMILTDAGEAALTSLNRRVTDWAGPIVQVQALTPDALAAGDDFALHRLLEEVVVTTNTAAAGGNASLMSIG
jgi:RHH-type transcriptional regulator, proline utilization regulon repressor / proline dehydrogenase / delta 1-pyrroline-5-carboxylate dehydrogenase